MIGPTRGARRPWAYFVRNLSTTPAKWAGSVWGAALLALAGCAGAPPPPPVPPPPPPAPEAATPSGDPRDFVTWNAHGSAAIACRLTKTVVEVPEAWRADARRIDAGEVVWQPAGEHRRALLVRGADHRLTVQDGLDDMKRLLELLGVTVPALPPEDASDQTTALLNDEGILPSLDFIDVNAAPYEVEGPEPEKGTFVLGYRILMRDDATCRIATVAPKSDPAVQQLSDFLDAVDTPRPTDPHSLSIIHPSPAPKIPPAICKAWPVWMFPSCGPAKPAQTTGQTANKP